MNEPSQPKTPRSFILRLLLDESGELHGQISEPSSGDEWRTTFATVTEMVDTVLTRLGSYQPPLQSPSALEKRSLGAESVNKQP